MHPDYRLTAPTPRGCVQELLPFSEPERWLPVVGWEGLHEVSDLGRVRSLPRKGGNNRWW